MADARPTPVDSIYSAETLAERQQMYPHFFRGMYQQMIAPKLSAEEALAVGEVQFRFPASLPGQEPFGFSSTRGAVTLSIASLKFLNDLMLAYCWLGRHKYLLSTIDDYLLMLRFWHADCPPPDPLGAMGIPGDAIDEAGTGELHVDWIKRAYFFILLHELGHLRWGDTGAEAASPAQSQRQESRADAFALDVMGRLGLVQAGITQFFEWASAFMPNPADYADDDSYWKAVSARNHPLTTDRLVQAANDIEANAGLYAKDQSPETLAAFGALAQYLRKLASLKRDPDMLRIAFRRGAMLRSEDLAPRRPGELIAMPAGPPGPAPFHGKLAGTTSGAGMSDNIEVVLRNQAGAVTGSYANWCEIGRLAGTARDNQLDFRWELAGFQGRGVLSFDGTSYAGTLGMDAAPGQVTWNLRPA